MNNTDVASVTSLLRRRFGSTVSVARREKIDLEWAPVERWFLEPASHDSPESIIVKTRRHDENGMGVQDYFLNSEGRALNVLRGSGFAPELYAFDEDSGVILMEDIIDAVTVEKILFGDDPDLASKALISMARTVGRINGDTVGLPKGTWNPDSVDLINSEDRMSPIKALLARHDFPVLSADPGVWDAVFSLIQAPELRALTQWDVVPSNAMYSDVRAVSIDFEYANPGSLAIDGAAFALGFGHYRYWAPLPDAVVKDMCDSWIQGVVEDWKEAPALDELMRILAAGAISKTLDRLTRMDRIADDGQPKQALARRRPQIMDSLERTAKICESANAFEQIAAWMNELAAEMRSRWEGTMGERIFPAFNNGSRAGWTLFHSI